MKWQWAASEVSILRYLCNNPGGYLAISSSGGSPSLTELALAAQSPWNPLLWEEMALRSVSSVSEGFPRPPASHALFPLQHYMTGLQESAPHLKSWTFHLLFSGLAEVNQTSKQQKKSDRASWDGLVCDKTGKPFVLAINTKWSLSKAKDKMILIFLTFN